MARGSVACVINHGHIYVSSVIRLHTFFPCFDNSLHSHRDSHHTLVSGLHLFQIFIGDGEGRVTIYTLRSYIYTYSEYWGNILRIQEVNNMFFVSRQSNVLVISKLLIANCSKNATNLKHLI